MNRPPLRAFLEAQMRKDPELYAFAMRPHEVDVEKQIQIIEAAEYVSADPPKIDELIVGMLAARDKFLLVGQTKTWKSFFAFQMSLCLSSGTAFLGFEVPRKRRVLLAQLEIPEEQFHRRVHRAARALLGSKAAFTDIGALGVVNGRGRALEIDDLIGLAIDYRAEAVVVDPFYKLHRQDEIEQAAIIETLAGFDRLCQRTGAALVFVHHDGKGAAGDRGLRDRGSGSGILNRDYDGCLALCPHASEAEAVVVEFLLRHHKSPDPITLRFCGGAFAMAQELAPQKETAATRRAASSALPPIEVHLGKAIEYLSAIQEMPLGGLKAKLQGDLHLPQKRVREVIAALRDSPLVEFVDHQSWPQKHTVRLRAEPQPGEQSCQCGQNNTVLTDKSCSVVVPLKDNNTTGQDERRHQ